MHTLQIAGMISKELKRSGVVDKAPQLASNIAKHFHEEGLTVCDLKPLGELLGCEPEMGEIERKTHQGVVLIKALRKKIDDLVNRPTLPSAAWYCAQVAQALNWERTEFDTLDELLEELREQDNKRNAITYEHFEQIVAIGKKLHELSKLSASRAQRKLLDEAIELLGSSSGRDDLVELDSAKLEALRAPYNLPRTHNCRHVSVSPSDTHTLLHAGELYREVTILLHTEQLVAWRTADGQEYSAPAHQVLLDPDEDGLAAAILSRIAGVEIAPEHMAELRAQMAGGVTHG